MDPLHTAKSYSLDEALRAQQALRSAAGLGQEAFPVEAFAGMVSDEIDALRRLGYSDEAIAGLIRKSSAIEITAGEIEANYAPPEARHQPRE